MLCLRVPCQEQTKQSMLHLLPVSRILTPVLGAYHTTMLTLRVCMLFECPSIFIFIRTADNAPTHGVNDQLYATLYVFGTCSHDILFRFRRSKVTHEFHNTHFQHSDDEVEPVVHIYLHKNRNKKRLRHHRFS